MMADCDEILRSLYSFLDGELSPNARTSIMAHLEGCLDCLHVYDFHAELRSVIARKCRDELPAGLFERVQNCFGVDAPAAFEASPMAAAPTMPVMPPMTIIRPTQPPGGGRSL
jgi:mycothiol system anti-sigma-R factor